MKNSQIISKYFNFNVIISGNYQIGFFYFPKWRYSVPYVNLKTNKLMMFLAFELLKILFAKHYDLTFSANENKRKIQ